MVGAIFDAGLLCLLVFDWSAGVLDNMKTEERTASCVDWLKAGDLPSYCYHAGLEKLCV